MSIKEGLRTFLQKTGLWAPYQDVRMKLRHKQIPIDKIRRQESPFTQMSGFSGLTVDSFPTARFYKMYLIDPQKAHDAFRSWFHDCLFNLKAWKIPPSEGGWQGGLLVTEIFQRHQERGINLEDLEQADYALVDGILDTWIARYFDLLVSIKENGFIISPTSPIKLKQKNGDYVVVTGHHRVSALWALGYKTVDAIVI
jgi:hypothetical protein